MKPEEAERIRARLPNAVRASFAYDLHKCLALASGRPSHAHVVQECPLAFARRAHTSMNEVLFNDFYELGRLDFYLFFFSFFFPNGNHRPNSRLNTLPVTSE